MTGKKRAFSVVELLVAVIIIMILASIAIPVLTNRSSQARLAKAESDLEHIQNAEERIAIDSGYFFRLYVLDDVIGGDGTGTGQSGDRIDGIRDEHLNALYSRDKQIFIAPDTQRMLDATQAQITYDRLVSSETAFGFNGPYLSWQDDPDNNDIGNDPWGNDYLLFTQYGLVNEPLGDLTFDESSEGKGATIGWPPDAPSKQVRVDKFGRPTILSMGPDGLPGDWENQTTPEFGTGDDMFRQF